MVNLASLVERGELTDADRNAIFGRLSSRAVLFILKKRKDGIEKSQYKSFLEIKERYLAEVAAKGAVASVQATAPTQKTDGHAETATAQDVSDPKWIANRNGFVIGSNYVLKDEKSTVHTLTEFDAEGGVFKEWDVVSEAESTMTIKFEELKKTFMSYKGKFALQDPRRPGSVHGCP